MYVSRSISEVNKLARWNNIRSFFSNLPSTLLPSQSPKMDVDTSIELRLEDTRDAPAAEVDLSDEENQDDFDTENVPNRHGEF